MLIAERFISGLVRIHGKHPVSTDGGTWYPQACRFLKLDHHIHSSLEKSLIERTMQYIKDRTESFDDYFPCKSKNCKLKHVRNWLQLFVDHHNSELKMLKWTEPVYTRVMFFYLLGWLESSQKGNNYFLFTSWVFSSLSVKNTEPVLSVAFSQVMQ